jgi:cytochrome c
MRNRPLIFLMAMGAAALVIFVAPAMRPLLAENDPGKQAFEKRCTGCHALDNEKAGPRLRGVYGRPAAAVTSYPYSEALRKSGITWNSGTLDKWLTDPDALVPDNDMTFRVVNPEEREAIIGYLKAVSSE